MSDKIAQAMLTISKITDPDKLHTIIRNANVAKETAVARAAQERLYEVAPAFAPGSFEHAVWKCIYALEDAKTEERGLTIRLGRTRQKIARDGEYQTVLDLVTGKKSSGFDMMIERDMPQYTFEAVTLRHPELFDHETRKLASERLAEVGYKGE
ncbi:hypothetical protein [Altererythrobacter fulvus]|uniref:hypothetical protein n=1 Tax=Caenibius fulvus TaxID=2126012 RepID=UPI0030186BDF